MSLRQALCFQLWETWHNTTMRTGNHVVDEKVCYSHSDDVVTVDDDVMGAMMTKHQAANKAIDCTLMCCPCCHHQQ